uniref:(northern house mosquito) hypothetical protein n=1 Tax=Culex pipiens TaxID=7175 RepID=A0A8D8CCW2_CULPI
MIHVHRHHHHHRHLHGGRQRKTRTTPPPNQVLDQPANNAGTRSPLLKPRLRGAKRSSACNRRSEESHVYHPIVEYGNRLEATLQVQDEQASARFKGQLITSGTKEYAGVDEAERKESSKTTASVAITRIRER